MKKILELDYLEAKKYFLKPESYFNFDLPKYFIFHEIIQKVADELEGKMLNNYLNTFINKEGKTKPTHPYDFDKVNYIFLNNKDGKFAWRPFQLIHPAIYASLVNNITEEASWNKIVSRFRQFASNPKIVCQSIPLQSEGPQSNKAVLVSQWWQLIEQQSIELALEYEYILHTDIADCYGSIYTHSIPWAIHTKPIAKDPANRINDALIGNSIDKHLRNMSYGQTNGIPQGSVLMDFIAEIVLGYADTELSDRIEQSNIRDYHIIRFRDDYRIFTNNPKDSDLITKILTEVLIELGMRLNSQKTIISDNVIRNSIKPDKYYSILQKNRVKSLQSHLLLIHDLSERYPNSGSLIKSLNLFYNRIVNLTKSNDTIVLISILMDIMFKNPRTYPITAAILSKFISLIEDDNKREIILLKIMNRFTNIPNTGYIKIWLQRLL